MGISILQEGDRVAQNDNIPDVIQSLRRFAYSFPSHTQAKVLSKPSVNAVFDVNIVFNLGIALLIKMYFQENIFVCHFDKIFSGVKFTLV